MKIISNAANRETCQTCGTIYEYEPHDLKPMGVGCVMVECPVCGQKVYIVNEIKPKTIYEPIDVECENVE